jgi:nucleoside-diphosphate-sugar epimerase
MEFCYVGNAVHGLILAMEHAQAAGERFFISDGSKSLIQVVQAVAAAEGVKPRLWHLPPIMAYMIAWLIEGLALIWPWKPFRSPITHKPFFTRKTVFWTTHSVNICSYQKAQHRLGYVPLFPLTEGVAETVRDFRARAWI